MTGPPTPEDPDAIQLRIRQARARVLGGRGTGASDAETAAAQRDRATLGSVPAAVERQRVADQAIVARGDPDELIDVAARASARIAVGLRTLADTLRGHPARPSGGSHGILIGVLAGVLVVVVLRTLRRGGARRSHRSGH